MLQFWFCLVLDPPPNTDEEKQELSVLTTLLSPVQLQPNADSLCFLLAPDGRFSGDILRRFMYSYFTDYINPLIGYLIGVVFLHISSMGWWVF